tara:strand:+ start:5597 stop:6397 length:801 start_codon:yes stop_codon:yes gene_type:complete
MKKDAYYFSHDANAQHDPKILKMLSQLGWEGYGLYWAIVERLRNEPTYALECDYDCIAYALRADRDVIKKIIMDYNLFEVYDGSFWSESLLGRMKKKEEISRKAKESALKRWKGNTTKKQTQSKRNTIKENKNKVKKTPKELNYMFIEFWTLYDKRVGDKSKVHKKWESLTNSDREKIMKTLPDFLKTIKDKQYQPYPMTYLNNKRWEDDLTIKKTSEEKLLESQENQIKRERKKQQDEWDSIEKKSASPNEISSIINDWKKKKNV